MKLLMFHKVDHFSILNLDHRVLKTEMMSVLNELIDISRDELNSSNV